MVDKISTLSEFFDVNIQLRHNEIGQLNEKARERFVSNILKVLQSMNSQLCRLRQQIP